jgi:hypothetical protein
MNSSVDRNRVPYPIGTVYISSSLALADVAERVSKLLGVELKEDMDGEYEEFPAYFGNVLKLRFAVMASESKQAPYILDVHPQFSFVPPFSDAKAYQTIDISLMLQAILSELSDWKLSVPT